jgi:hypothetical protein
MFLSILRSRCTTKISVLTTDAAVRLYPENELGDLQYPVGKAPAQVSTTIEAQGDPGNWPFDSYKTQVIAADVFTGSGQSREKAPARVGIVGGHSGGVGQDRVLAADDNVVWRDAVRHCPATQYPPGQPTIRFVDRPSHRAMGADRAGWCDGPVPGRLVAATGAKVA